ncbi:hypothetical protein IQ249_21995 [Lusitaniella coriacea LEGE 07157]|uniref:Uncharacterized protein n=1 Tax=Lusitaniella coriacea LEGE 07157 TaxID=945747 RepID=A0A8J7E061_9CYAN|nr:hypothetical protein [Lusitaniella coriacea]MBE9118565.1 hypothetical protein [Lusitaniella coriacea LEGE 07157]
MMTKARFISLLMIGILWNSFEKNVVAQNTRTDNILEFVNRVARQLSINCSKTIEVNYKSQEIISPDRTKSVYFEAITRNINSASNSPNTSCPIGNGGTPVAKMIQTESSRKQEIDFHSFLGDRYNTRSSATVINPISWSSDSRYLLVRVDFLAGYDGHSDHLIFDAENNYRLVSFQPNSLFSPCNKTEIGSNFLGFTSTNIAAFECQNYGEPGYIEILDLQRRRLQRVNRLETNQRLQNYGRVSSFSEIKKVQEFQGR